ncbi:hypothetical protein CCHR01_16464 [Colletotrichum chrysophilum]|uniref:Uncharacterized protein n=1 Tax=Colletotrichum chrysophilum TaxID=1836956 RepID=A0AAD9A4B0_9PEZI|nr:hypothetical protein CCHR01_16464 [Colletotrichum chrysophilum]
MAHLTGSCCEDRWGLTLSLSPISGTALHRQSNDDDIDGGNNESASAHLRHVCGEGGASRTREGAAGGETAAGNKGQTGNTIPDSLAINGTAAGAAGCTRVQPAT